mmetsp:Transcript_7489/g.9251  ORF Transcript_7489/g.9251 Transcript_7489/m.9251 type:complete len:82 (+) Transcript_7489:108-353(+)|eukprot:CAMPEP_0172498232 /NCGR_PEP_ID=MMETSP1066-20121228/110992_1 /TAXON_ID=671091 /ORGANISM="Coscinodiscus wailesii, Strain CCMP2513" /LENGTH=81 /DNA_ID=CAMNT_0013271431 /DNA_START=107 /DNA_END=352 /DNA_ORIENTATION=+
MKLAIRVTLATLIPYTALAFVPAFIPRSSISSKSRVFQESGDGDEEGLDLDLGEMFEMFDAADKGEDFEKAAERIKSKDED